MKILGLLCLYIFLGASLAFANSIVVQNGGEGVQDGTGLYLRDLYQPPYKYREGSGFTGNVVVNSHIDALIPDFQFSDLRVPTVLLVFKLSEIESRYNNVGLILAEVIAAHDWTGVDQRLELLEDPAPNYRINQSYRRQIALRYGRKVKIDTKLFNELSETHKVALILHEAIYSLMNNHHPSFQSEEALREVMRDNMLGVRELVYRFWYADELKVPNEMIQSLLGPSALIVKNQPSWDALFNITYDVKDRTGKREKSVWWQG